jgi:hypothetical protein
VRKPVDVRLTASPKRDFISQQRKDWCAPAGVQIALAILGLTDNEERTQRGIADRVKEWESRRDSKNGGWGPGAIAQALEAYGAPGYEIRAYERRSDALRDAARALSATGKPVISSPGVPTLGRPATGRRRPLVFDDATIKGTYIYDRTPHSSIWGASTGRASSDGRDAPQLPALAASRGSLPRPRRPLPGRRPDHRPGRRPARRDALTLSLIRRSSPACFGSAPRPSR